MQAGNWKSKFHVFTLIHFILVYSPINKGWFLLHKRLFSIVSHAMKKNNLPTPNRIPGNVLNVRCSQSASVESSSNIAKWTYDLVNVWVHWGQNLYHYVVTWIQYDGLYGILWDTLCSLMVTRIVLGETMAFWSFPPGPGQQKTNRWGRGLGKALGILRRI